VARLLAQDAPVALLDEPTTALDVGHQQQVLDLVDALRHDHGLTVIATMHDLTLAAQYGDRVALLDGGHLAATGTASEVLTSESLSALYGARVRVLREGDSLVVVPFRDSKR
jgi:iron complex transport system ATP-binding protein